MRVIKFLQTSFLIAVLVSSGCKKETEVESAKKIDANTVEVATTDALKLIKIERTMFPETIEVNGKVSIPDKDIVNVSARVQGRIESLPVTIGDRVQNGQSLGSIWSPDLITAAEEYKMAVAQNDKELVELSRSKLRALGMSPGDISGSRTSFPLRAPMEGVVMDKKLNAGSAVNVGDLILVVGKNTAHQFSAEVPPEVALKIKTGMKVRFPEREESLTATVANVSPVADPTTNLVKVRCQFNGLPPTGIPQETYLKAEIVIRESQSLVAPLKALILTNDGERIFVQDLKDPKVFHRVPVQINSRNKLQMDVVESNDIKEGRVTVGQGVILLEGVLEGED
jgi:multidrug efflux pump subunit AcrA (membrane-fusion protein)